MLAANNITLTAGSNTRRQFLSPIEYKFSLILISLGFSLEDISKFFLIYEQYDKHLKNLVIIKQKRLASKKSNKNYKKHYKNNNTLSPNKSIKKYNKNNNTLSTNKNYKKRSFKNQKVNRNLKQISPFSSLGNKREFTTSIVVNKDNNNSTSPKLTIKGERKREIKLDLQTNIKKV